MQPMVILPLLLLFAADDDADEQQHRIQVLHAILVFALPGRPAGRMSGILGRTQLEENLLPD